MNKINTKGVNAQILYNFISTIIRTSVSFFTMPIFTRLLGAEQYGKYSLVFSWIAIFSCIMGLNIASSIARGMYRFKNDYVNFKSSILLAETIISIIIIVIAILAFSFVHNYIEFSFLIYCVILFEALAEAIVGFVGVTWIYEKKARNNMLLTLVTVTFSTALSILLILIWPDQEASNLYYARVLGIFVPQIIICSIIWCKVFLKHPYGYNKKYWRYGLSFGIPMVFHTLSHNVLTSSDRIMMQQFNVSGNLIGIYSFFYTLASILNSILSALNNSWVPFYMDNLANKNYTKLNKMIVSYTKLFTAITLGLLMLAREMTYFFANEEYWEGLPVLPIIICAIYCLFLYQFYVNYESFEEKPRVITMGTVIAAIENIVLNYIFIPKFGIYGAAIATLISYGTLVTLHALVSYIILNHKYPLSSRPQLIGFTFIIFGSILYYVLSDFWLIRWCVAAMVAIYILIDIYKRKTIF